MTWLQISNEVNRKLVVSASPNILDTEMPGLLNETYDELLTEWVKMMFERDELATEILAPMKRGPATPTLTSTVFWIDPVVFPLGLRTITSFRGLFTQTCSGVEEWRNIDFLPDNDLDDLENPLRKPTNDHPKYRMWYDSQEQMNKITIECDSAPSTVKIFYIKDPVLVTTALLGSPEVHGQAHYQIVKRAVKKQSGIDEDPRFPVFQDENQTDKKVISKT